VSKWLQPFRRRDLLVDVAVVLVVFLVYLTQVGSQGFGEYEGSATDADGLGLGLILITVLPLLGRRRHPWAAMAIAGAGAIALAACGYSANVPAALIVVLYTFAAGAGGARIWPPIAFAALLYATQVAFEIAEISVSIEDYAFPALLLAGAWVLGDRHRTASQRRAEAHERREREERLSIAEERTRIARELHDSAGHAINTILVQAGASRCVSTRCLSTPPT